MAGLLSRMLEAGRLVHHRCDSSHEWLGYCQGCWRQGDSFITDVIAAMNGRAIVKDVGGFAQIRKLDCKMLGHNMLRNVV